MKPLRVLHVEDNPQDAKLLDRELQRSGFEVTALRVQTAKDLEAILVKERFDIILSDYAMPSFSGRDALEIVKRSGVDTPFILVSGSVGEERAVDSLKSGASDFIIKQNLARLGPAVERELKDAQTRREREEAFRALQEALDARDEFLSIASHELKTPLAAVRLKLQGLLRSLESRRANGAGSDDVVVAAIQSADRSAHRLATLIERLLDISRISAGRLELSPKTVDLTALTSECVNLLSDFAAKVGSPIHVEGASSVIGEWDPDRLSSVLTNLIENAIKYGAAKPVRIRIEDLGERAAVRVEDQGIGVTPGSEQRIFERFERGVAVKHFGGFGLGLWLSRKIVDAHGGMIAVESDPGQGSTFAVVLPKQPKHGLG